MPGATDGRKGMAGRRPGGPGVVGAVAADTEPGATAAVDGNAAGAVNGAPAGPARGVAEVSCISAEGDVVLLCPLCAREPPRGRLRRQGTRQPSGGGDASGVIDRRGGVTGTGTMGPSRCPARATGGAYLTRRATARGPRGGPGWRAREGAGVPERARQATADRAPRGGCSALRVGQLLPLVCNDRLGGLNLHGGIHLHWLVTARVNSNSGKLGPGDGFCPFRTKGDDGGRHRRRRQVNRVFMSWRFDRPYFPDLESHSGRRESGPDGRYFPPPEVTPLIVVLHKCRKRVSNRPLRGLRGRFRTLLHLLECGSFGKTAASSCAFGFSSFCGPRCMPIRARRQALRSLFSGVE